MSDLQIGLLILGLFVIGSVIAFNWFQEKQFRRRVEQGFKRPEADALLAESKPVEPAEEAVVLERIDPHLGPQVAEQPLHQETEEALQPEATASAAPGSAAAAASLPDAAINYVAEIRAGEVLPASMIQDLAAALSGTGRKYQLFGYDYNQRAWQPVADADQWYTSAKVFVQLVDRGGAVTREQLEQVVALLREKSQEVSAICEAADIDEAMTRALSLDDFCLEVDIIVGLSVAARPGQVLHGTQLRALAESNGLKLDPTGVFVMPDGQGGTLFSMDNQESNPFRTDELKNLTTRSVTFLLDVPRTSDGIKVFNKMVAVCKQFADSLDAMLCDDNRAMLNDSGLEKIRNQLRTIYEAMEQRGIPAGSETARQLFS
jgi:FtsZ-interacting cell division protein ZipA